MEGLLATAMATAVPLWIMRLREAGGPTQADIERCRELSATLSGPGGEGLVVSGEHKKGEVAKAFNAAAEGIAILSFCPGGIRIFGMLFCGRHEQYGTSDIMCPMCLETAGGTSSTEPD